MVTSIAFGVLLTILSADRVVAEACGGTLGAIYSIFLAALTIEARAAAEQHKGDAASFPWGKVTGKALLTLQRSTHARKGMRTVMDALIPLVEELEETEDFAKAAAACEKGAKDTASMTAKLGRAAYVGEREGGLPPDPGAMSLAFVVQGMMKALRT